MPHHNPHDHSTTLTATAVAAGRATALPRARTGCVEAIRAIRVARRSAVKARAQTAHQAPCW